MRNTLGVRGVTNMSGPIYKYVGPAIIGEVLSGLDCVHLKCSHPEDFQDPYELSLTIDFAVEPEALAFYQEVVGELPQLPTTCFSKSPAIIPMWAHYAFKLEGAVLEFDEHLVQESCPESSFGDVEYRDGLHDGLNGMLHRAHVIGKPRYVYFLQSGVFHAAYFTKATCWSYELERRMVIQEANVRHEPPLMLLDVPIACVTSVVAGPRASEATKALLREFAAHAGTRYLEMRVGRSAAAPYFVEPEGTPHQFNGERIEASSQYCGICGEPTRSGDLCSWCAMEDAHREQAASSNPFRMLADAGMLESYLDGMDAIGRVKHGDDA